VCSRCEVGACEQRMWMLVALHADEELHAAAPIM
jgi:hypothetical protein